VAWTDFLSLAADLLSENERLFVNEHSIAYDDDLTDSLLRPDDAPPKPHVSGKSNQYSVRNDFDDDDDDEEDSIEDIQSRSFLNTQSSKQLPPRFSATAENNSNNNNGGNKFRKLDDVSSLRNSFDEDSTVSQAMHDMSRDHNADESSFISIPDMQDNSKFVSMMSAVNESSELDSPMRVLDDDSESKDEYQYTISVDTTATNAGTNNNINDESRDNSPMAPEKPPRSEAKKTTFSLTSLGETESEPATPERLLRKDSEDSADLSNNLPTQTRLQHALSSSVSNQNKANPSSRDNQTQITQEKLSLKVEAPLLNSNTNSLLQSVVNDVTQGNPLMESVSLDSPVKSRMGQNEKDTQKVSQDTQVTRLAGVSQFLSSALKRRPSFIKRHSDSEKDSDDNESKTLQNQKEVSKEKEKEKTAATPNTSGIFSKVKNALSLTKFGVQKSSTEHPKANDIDEDDEGIDDTIENRRLIRFDSQDFHREALSVSHSKRESKQTPPVEQVPPPSRQRDIPASPARTSETVSISASHSIIQNDRDQQSASAKTTLVQHQSNPQSNPQPTPQPTPQPKPQIPQSVITSIPQSIPPVVDFPDQSIAPQSNSASTSSRDPPLLSRRPSNPALTSRQSSSRSPSLQNPTLTQSVSTTNFSQRPTAQLAQTPALQSQQTLQPEEKEGFRSLLRASRSHSRSGHGLAQRLRHIQYNTLASSFPEQQASKTPESLSLYALQQEKKAKEGYMMGDQRTGTTDRIRAAQSLKVRVLLERSRLAVEREEVRLMSL
jgi:hypothetical protein